MSLKGVFHSKLQKIARIVNGDQWYKGTNKLFEKTNITQIIFGSRNYKLDGYFGDFKGLLSELNIWSGELNKVGWANVASNIEDPQPLRYVLTQILKGVLRLRLTFSKSFERF